MARRMIDDSMWANESFAEMPMGARLLMIGIINHADDQGRIKANPAYLRAQIFPYDDIPSAEIQRWLEIIHLNDTLNLYVVDGKQYLQLTNWWKYQNLQYAQPSQYPRPSGWQDRIRKTLTKGTIVTCNWLKVNGESIPDTCDQDGNPVGSAPKQANENTKSLRNTPVNQSSNGDDSPDDSGNQSGESSGEDTIYSFNLTKLSSSNEASPESTPPTAPAAFVSEYERVWALPIESAYRQEQIDAWSGRVTIDGWRYALRECADHRKVGQWRYLETILKRIEAEGVPEFHPEAVPKKQTVTGNLGFSMASI